MFSWGNTRCDVSGNPKGTEKAEREKKLDPEFVKEAWGLGLF